MSKKIISPQTTQPQPLIYCGPALPGVANHGMLFIVPPPMFVQYIRECPAISSFVVQPHEYVQTKKAALQKGSFLNIQCETILKYLQKGGKL